MATTGNDHHVVIIGGGFGGLYAAKSLSGSGVSVTLVDRRNHHLFQPLLYQVATGGLSPADVAQPLRAIFAKQKDVRVLLGDVTDVDVDGRTVILKDGEIPYDDLIVAAGARSSYFGNDSWEADAPSLKSVEDATEIRSRVLTAFERAERTNDPDERHALLTFCVVGAGPTGVELAGTLGEIARHTLREEFRAIDPAEARVLLIEGSDRVLSTYAPDLSEKAARSLAELGVTVLTNTIVTSITAERVEARCGEERHTIEARTALWAAGVDASPLARVIADRTGADVDRAGRIHVGDDLRPKGSDSVYVIGDMARCEDAEGNPLPGVAPVAMQQGAHVARSIRDRLAGKPEQPFRYKDRGSMAPIGRSRAIADLGWIRFSGLTAWLAWLFIHLIYIVEYQSRVLVLTQWGWNYFTWSRTARLITGVAGERRNGNNGRGSASDRRAA